jgi:hypothetical protein
MDHDDDASWLSGGQAELAELAGILAVRHPAIVRRRNHRSTLAQ